MKIQISTKNIEIDEWLENIVQKKLVYPLEKYLKTLPEDIKEAKVNIERCKRTGYFVNFNMLVPGKKQIFAETKNKQLIPAVVELREKLERELEKYRTEKKNL